MRLFPSILALLSLAGTLHGAMQWNGVNISELNGAHKISLNGTGISTYPQMTASVSGTDGNGVVSYNATSIYNVGTGPATTVLRVLPPASPAAVPHKILLMLPVKPLLDFSFGDGLNEVRINNGHNSLNAHVVAPSFPTEPWMGDNPTTISRRYENFCVDLVKWCKLNLSTIGGQEEVIPISFSKGGYSAIHMLFRNPGTIAKAAVFDVPTAQPWSQISAATWDGQLSYDTQTNWTNKFDPVARLSGWSTTSNFQTTNRLWIVHFGVAGAFGPDTVAYDAALTSAGVQHTYNNAIGGAHNWNSGWIDDAIAWLSGPDVTPPTLTSATVNGTGTTMTFLFSENMTAGVGGNSGLVATMTGGASTLSYSTGGGTPSLVYTMARTIAVGETGTVAFTQPGNGLEDMSGNDLASFSGVTVVNGVSSIAEVPSMRAISDTTTASQDSKALAYPTNVVAGDMLTVGGTIWTSGGTTVAPAVTTALSGTTFTVNLADATPTGTTWRTFLAYAVAGASGAATVTVNPNGASSDFCFGIDAFRGVTQLDVDGSDTMAASSTAAQDTITTVAPGTLILGVVSNETGTTMTPLASYTQIVESESGSNNQPTNFQFRIVTSAGAYTPGCTLGANSAWQCQTLSLKP